MSRVKGFVLLAVAALVAAPSAFAQTQGDGYDGSGGVLGSVGGGSAGGGGSLPFTGLDLLFVILAGLALVTIGIVMRMRRAGSAD